MANRLPSFASGSNLAITINGKNIAYATNLSFSDDVAHAAIGGIGSYSYDTLEPLSYLARGSMSVIRYSSKSATRGKDGLTNFKPSRMADNVDAKGTSTLKQDGNGMLDPLQFNPTKIMLSRTFDIVVYERDGAKGEASLALFTIQDCRMTSYSITFTPGQLISENIGFICIKIDDKVAKGQA